MNYTIRPERKDELSLILDLVKSAFEGVEESDHQEQYLVEQLHKSATFIPELSLVAENREGVIVGYILLTQVQIISTTSVATSLAVAPLAVLPDFQNRGIGGLLLNEAHQVAAKLGYGTAVLLGHKDYYPRFGYKKAVEYGINFPFDAPQDCCLVIGLLPDALNGIKGTVHYPDCFQLN